MVLHTLYENGVMDISELENYVHDEVEKGSGRLDDVHRRLQTSYQDLLSVSLRYKQTIYFGNKHLYFVQGPTEKTVEDIDGLLNEEETFVT